MLWNNTLFTTKEKGDITESYAANHLIKQGLKFIEANFRSKCGEIDLVMKEDDTWVFVEVKYRKKATYGGAISTISASKQQKLTRCAAFYLQQAQLNEYNTPCRFDVIALQGDIKEPQLTWLKNAF